jgi:O-antigen ligase
MLLKVSSMGWVALVCLALFFIWLFYKGYKAYQKNGWDDPFFKDDGSGMNGGGFFNKQKDY